MKNAHTGKLITQILNVVLCAVIVTMLACCFNPYFTITEEYNFVLNPDPQPVHYSLAEAIWIDPSVINDHFTSYYEEQGLVFEFNYFITNLALSFIFGVATVATCIWHSANVLRKYPSMTAGVFTQICSFGWALFSLMGYLNNVMLDNGVPAFMYIRDVIIVLVIVGAVLTVVRFVVWLLTELKISKDRKERLAKL